jgi:hypothetical protein
LKDRPSFDREDWIQFFINSIAWLGILLVRFTEWKESFSVGVYGQKISSARGANPLSSPLYGFTQGDQKHNALSRGMRGEKVLPDPFTFS